MKNFVQKTLLFLKYVWFVTFFLYICKHLVKLIINQNKP